MAIIAPYPTGIVGGTGGGGGGGGGAAPGMATADAPPPAPTPVPTTPVPTMPVPTTPVPTMPVPRTVVSGGVLNGKAVSKSLPVYPAIAKAASVNGTVSVQVVVDEAGRVVSARAVGGHPLLQASAVAAAYKARFTPTLLSGQPVSVSGVINYNFTTGGATAAGELESLTTAAPPTAEEQRWRQFLAKLHPLVASLAERLREGKEEPGEGEATFVRDGQAELRISLTEKTPAVLGQLKALGFELILDAPSASLVVGRLPLEKLQLLADIEAVRHVAPEIKGE